MLNDMGKLVTRSYSQGLVTIWNLVNSSAIVLKQWYIAGELQLSLSSGTRICSTILIVFILVVIIKLRQYLAATIISSTTTYLISICQNWKQATMGYRNGTNMPVQTLGPWEKYF
jgi:hypothetical protein